MAVPHPGEAPYLFARAISGASRSGGAAAEAVVKRCDREPCDRRLCHADPVKSAPSSVSEGRRRAIRSSAYTSFPPGEAR